MEVATATMDSNNNNITTPHTIVVSDDVEGQQPQQQE
jgi:hypothetical protein